MDSILDSLKKVLGIDPEYTAFDQDIIMFANSSFSKLTQMGVGPPDGFEIVDNKARWEDFLGESDFPMNMVKSYMVLSVRLLFDPPPTSFAIAALKEQLDEFSYRAALRAEEVRKQWPSS